MAPRSSSVLLLLALIPFVPGCGDNLVPRDAAVDDAPVADAPVADAPIADAPIDAPDVDAPIDAAIDAPDIDAAIDAPIDAPPIPTGPVTVTVTLFPRAFQLPPNGPPPPVPNIPVIVTHPDGSIGARGTTDAAGRVTLEVQPGSWVTAIFRVTTTPARAIVKTIAGVEPGDELVINGIGTSVPPTSAPFTYAWPALPAGATYATVTDRCGRYATVSGTSVAARTEPYCAGASGALFLAISTVTGLHSYAHLPSVARVPGETYTAGPWQPAGTLPITVTDLPPQTTALAWLDVGGLVPGDVQANGSGSHNLPPVGGAATVTVPWPPPVTRAHVMVSFGHVPSQVVQTLQVRTDAAGSVSVSAGALLPFITTPATADLAARTIAWTQTAGAPPDGIHLELWHPTADWIMLVPPGATQYAFPRMPPDVADAVPPTTGSAVAAYAYLLEYDHVTSYRAMRHLPDAARIEHPHPYGAARVRTSRSR